jgi:hypothetical protein
MKVSEIIMAVVTMMVAVVVLAFWIIVTIPTITRPGLPSQAPTYTPWFTITSGSTTCKTVQVIKSPISINYSCTNPYGGIAGSYTANGAGGALGGEIFTFALNSMGPIDDSVYCVVSVNSTTGPLLMGTNGLAVAANSAVYSCSGTTGPLPSGTGGITWASMKVARERERGK